MNKKQAKLLLLTVQKAEAEGNKHFDMRNWIRPLDGSDPSCGTVCCMLGHGCSVPEVQKAGLMMGLFGPRFVGKDGYLRAHGATAGYRVYGLNPEDTAPNGDNIFMPSRGHKRLRDVARNFRAIIKKYHPDIIAAEGKRGAKG